MAYKIVSDLTPVNFTPGDISRVKYIVIHYFGALGSAQSVAAWFKSPAAKASAHYCVDEGELIYQSVRDKDVAWHCGHDPGGEYYHPDCRNANSIGIETRPRKMDTRTQYASDKDWYFDEEVTDRLVEITQFLMQKYSVPAERVLRHYDITHKQCLPTDVTEVLVPTGWVGLSNLNVGDYIATYSDKSKLLSFSPVRDIVAPYTAEVLRVRDIEATADHNMYIKPNATNSPNYGLRKFSEFFTGGHQWKVMTCANMIHKGIDLSDEQLRLLVWIQGDGNYDRKAIRFHFTKERKIQRLSALLEDLDIMYTKYTQTDGTTKIDIRDHGETMEWVETWLRHKKYTFKMLDMTKHQARVFFDELIHVDGSNDNLTYFTMEKENSDFVQALATVNKIRCHEYIEKNNLKVLSFNPMLDYSVITYNDVPEKKQSTHSKRITEVSCVTVDSGLVLIRQYGETSIVGNCPRPYTGDDINAYYGTSGNTKWAEFIARIKGDLTMAQADELRALIIAQESTIKELRTRLATLEKSNLPQYNALDDIPAWGQDAIRDAIDRGILTGVSEGNLALSWNDVRSMVFDDRREKDTAVM